jgi:hypothetical protein
VRFREKDPLTLEVLAERLRYEPDTGLFRWNYERSYKAKKDQVAGYTRGDGYTRIRINGLEYFAHRVAWFITHNGTWPVAEIDHINGVKDDNRISNLREADRILNLQNLKKARRDNLSTGLLGAYAYQKGFTSYIQVNKERMYLGWFKTAEDAHQAYMAAKRELHPGNTL